MAPEPVRLPPRGLLSPTSPVDAVLRYYRFGAGWVLRQRLKWARDALPGDRFGRLLEIGYGSGVFMHELGAHAMQLVGTDVHAHGARVRNRLAADGILLHAVQSSGDALPFRDGAFDAVVIVSALEYIRDPALALREAVRVVRTGGAVVCVTPRALGWAKRVYDLILRFDPDSRDRGGRDRVQAALADRSLRAERFLRPRLAPKFLAPYELIVLRRLPGGTATAV